MGIVTTHTEGRVVTHTSTDDSVEVVQLPARDAAEQAATGPAVQLVPGEVLDEAVAAPARKVRAKKPAAAKATKAAARKK